MMVVFGNVWALWWWRNTNVQVTADGLRTNVCHLDRAPSTVDELRKEKVYDMRQAYLARGFPRELPLDLVSRDSVPRARLAGVKVHQWNGTVPLGALCVAGSRYVCSPEFCFMQVARGIRGICPERLMGWQYVVVLAELACELCGTYSKQETKRGFKNRDVPLVSACQLFVFLGGVSHDRGASRAYDAIRWALDGLNSPMETALYLMLCLPRAWGGLALPRPRSNWRLEVPRELWTKTRQRHIVPDLYWPEHALIVEFFGEDFHVGREESDSERQELAQDMGYKVITFRNEDLQDLKRFNAKAGMVARYLGRELPEASDSFANLQDMLRKMLVAHPRWV